MNPKLDKEFLKELDGTKHKVIFARLTSLTFMEEPIEYIEGRITGGSINLDGASSSRRTCNITLVAQDININEFYWGITHKFKVEIGLINNIDDRYDNIIWFNQGVFVISTFNVAVTTNNYTITVNGKDKMSLLNGDLGGQVTAQTDFGKIDTDTTVYGRVSFKDKMEYVAGKYYIREIDWDEPDISKRDTYILSTDEWDGNTTYYEPITSYDKESIPLRLIITEMIHTYANEPYYNIIINDLQDFGIELLEYRGDTPLYLLWDIGQGCFVNMTVEDMTCYDQTNQTDQETTFSQIGLGERYSRTEEITVSVPNVYTLEPVSQNPTTTRYYISRVDFGETAGFRQTDLTYAGELIANVGETITSVLDKIKNMLGDFEYFYDIDGHFVFQRQKIYENQSWSAIVETEDKDILIENAVENSNIAYTFTNSNLITAFNNSPNLGNLRNDYSIWGVRKGVTGADIPVHLRYAIDKKPSYYKSFDGTIYATEELDGQSLIEYYKSQAIKEFYKFDRKTNPIFEGKQQLSSDWWYMSDWYNYYKKLTGEPPTDYIRFYATNRDGSDPYEKGYVENFDPKKYFNVVGDIAPRNIWLFHLELQEGEQVYTASSAQHNSSGSSVIRETSEPYAGTYTISPFNGCTSHKFDFFVSVDNGVATDKPGATGFFYKPNFPPASEELIEEKAQEYVDRYLEKVTLVCDWREIIYQMSVDYFKHNQEDDFYYNVMMNNGRREDGHYWYPNGKTGYEQYYTDINAFWRELYDPDPTQSYYTQGGYYAETIAYAEDQSIGFTKQTEWVGYEVNDAIFESQYYLPTSTQKYQLTDIEHMEAINAAEISLTVRPIDKSYIEWDPPLITYKVGSLTASEYPDGYEIWRSFYPASKYGMIPFEENQKIGSFNNHFYWQETKITNDLGTDEKLSLYYRVRGYKNITLADNETTKKVYTQWSNRCWVEYTKEKEVTEGKIVNEQVVILDGHIMSPSSLDQTDMVSSLIYFGNFDNDKKYWNKQVYEAPERLNFWFDFLDSESELAQYAVPVVGNRPKAVNDSKVTSIYFKETPNLIFVDYDNYDAENIQSGYTYIFLDEALIGLFSISAQGKSAKDVLDEYLYKFGYCIENVTITALPIYYLEPNTRIAVYDENTKINGEYNISKITIPLTYNGTMSITATKAVSRIY